MTTRRSKPTKIVTVGNGTALAKILPTHVTRRADVQAEADRLVDGMAAGVGTATVIGLGVIAGIEGVLRTAADKVGEVKP